MPVAAQFMLPGSLLPSDHLHCQSGLWRPKVVSLGVRSTWAGNKLSAHQRSITLGLYLGRLLQRSKGCSMQRSSQSRHRLSQRSNVNDDFLAVRLSRPRLIRPQVLLWGSSSLSLESVGCSLACVKFLQCLSIRAIPLLCLLRLTSFAVKDQSLVAMSFMNLREALGCSNARSLPLWSPHNLFEIVVDQPVEEVWR